MDDISLIYYGHVFEVSGYGQAARAYIHALHAAGVEVSVVDLSSHPRQIDDPLVSSLAGRHIDPVDFHLFHGVPPTWESRAAVLRNAIGMTVWETDTMPATWSAALSSVIDVWLPCQFNVDTFRSSLRTPIFRLPHPVPPRPEASHITDAILDPCIQASATDFVFYSIIEWQDRKGPSEMLRAYFRAFPDDGEQLLVIKTHPGAAGIGASAIEQLRRETGSRARVTLVACRWTDSQIDGLHARGNCYVSLHRGEGWGYPLFEAATRGTPAVATAYSGPMDYLGLNARLVPYTLVPVRQQYVHYKSHMQWAEPDVERAAELMREVYSERAKAGRRDAAMASQLSDAYSLERVGARAKERLSALLRDRNPMHWYRRNSESASPIPSSWYDENYFERGIKSNWQGGYSWTHFGGLFTETASFLIEMFPQATSYLDAGCAKGFLIRALRESGKECWGFDHSAWAMDHAEPEALPFMERAGVDEVRLDRQVDILLAFDLLSQLTEAQARAFLQRARERTNMAIIAVITSLESGEETQPHGSSLVGRDGSHVTFRQRTWWDALFKEAGWKLDALHRLGAERCQQHPLPCHMRWKLYVYAP